VIRAIESGYGYGGYGYGRPDPQGMPLTGNAPWGTPGHAANRHCSLGPAPAPVSHTRSVGATRMIDLLALERKYRDTPIIKPANPPENGTVLPSPPGTRKAPELPLPG
jgi:hypothetical protein